MTPRERKAMAEQITASPLYAVTMEALERAAMERAVYAPLTDHDTRAAALAEVRAIRSFRSNLEAALRDNAAMESAVA